MTIKAFRSALLHFISAPGSEPNPESAYEYFQDGLLIIENGRIKQLGPAKELIESIPKECINHYPKALIMPGFIDAHVHYPQVDMIASPGCSLLDWLNQYTFPAEKSLKSLSHAQDKAQFFLDELLRNGTTTAAVYATVHKNSVTALFKEAAARRMRIISGKVLSDRYVPKDLADDPDSAYRDSKDLIEHWHKHDRLSYAITPRFAVSSSAKQLKLAGKLLHEHPDVFLQTHLAENTQEIATVKKLFPKSAHYLNVYERYGLVGDKSIFAHGTHLSMSEWKMLAKTKAALVHCPTSNLFLNSGLFNLKRCEEMHIKLGLGTDVGAGTSLSMFTTLNEAYKIAHAKQHILTAFNGFYLATLGGAKALNLDSYIGNFNVGKEADFVVLNLEATPLLKRRLSSTKTLAEKLFVLMMLGDDRLIQETYILGMRAH